MAPPAWLNRDDYPFDSHFLSLPEGRIHYVDEGEGEVLLMMHGTPTWSYLYRHLIAGLRTRYRVIAPDHLGFGLSDKPAGYSYHPAEQARTIAAFIEALGLHDFTLVAHDFGGPISLAYALDHPQAIRRLILFNTWLWPLNEDRQIALAGRFLGSPLGRWLCMRWNFEANVIMPYAYGQRSKLTRAIHDHYRHPLRDEAARRAVWVYAKELLYAHAWYGTLWEKREALRGIPTLLLWGLKDPLFGPASLERWQSLFDDVQTVTFPATGHYVQEEQGEALVPHITGFVG